MELFFLCTIAMALVSFISMALAQPPATVMADNTTTVAEKELAEGAKTEASIIEFRRQIKERELMGLASA